MRASARMTEEQFAVFMENKPRNSNGLEVAPKRTLKVESRRDYKADLVFQLEAEGIAVEPEFKIFETRRFKADWRVRDTRILIEFEGGLFAKGKQGHSSVTGILRDIEKYNLCALGGWIVIRVAPNHVANGQALTWIQAAIETERR